MKLSNRRRFGHDHVRANRVVEVCKTHPVSLRGQSSLGSRSDVQEKPFCVPGDLAIEVWDVKKKRVLGYSVLTGAAIQLMSYEWDPEWFSESEIGVGILDMSGEPSLEVISEAKYGNTAISVFDVKSGGEAETKDSVEKLGAIWMHGEPFVNHLVGIIRGKRKKDGVAVVHFQPERHSGPDPCNPFQAGLLFDLAKRTKAHAG